MMIIAKLAVNLAKVVLGRTQLIVPVVSKVEF